VITNPEKGGAPNDFPEIDSFSFHLPLSSESFEAAWTIVSTVARTVWVSQNNRGRGIMVNQRKRATNTKNGSVNLGLDPLVEVLG
jgi:hypothetical protein